MNRYREEDREIAMFEFELYNNETGKVRIVFGYSLADAYRRSKLDPERYTCLRVFDAY